MATLEALHSMVLHLLPCLAQQAVPRVLLLMALQGILRGLVIQVITCPTTHLTRCVISVAHIMVPSCLEQATQLRALC